MNRIGERIRKRREYLQIPLNVLAKGVNVSSSLLSQIENGKAFPSLHTIKHIADYLNTTVGALIGENETFDANPVVKWEEKKFVKKNDSGATLYLLANYSPLQLMEIYALEIEPRGNSFNLIDNRRNGQEFCFVIEGSVEVVLQEKSFLVQTKDNMYFFSNDLRVFNNVHPDQKAILLWVISPLRNA
jgi:transcriptional regulator with XRE-family HTH domain